MSMIDALLEERRGYVMLGKKDRVALVDAEIKRLGGVVVADEPVAETAAFEASDGAMTATMKPPAGRPRKS